MKYYEKLLEMGCFRRRDIVGLLGNEDSAGSMIREYLKKGYIERVRHDLYAVISLETKQPVYSRYQIGCSIDEESCISHHSAFEYYGYANQVYYETYIASDFRFSDFEYNGVHYHRVIKRGGIDIIERPGLKVTGIEQTVIDSIRDYEKIGGFEETVRCIALIPSLNEYKLISALRLYDIDYLWQKSGYILTYFNETLRLSDEFFEECGKHISSGKRYLLSNGERNFIWNDRWHIYAPASLRGITDKGVDFNAV